VPALDVDMQDIMPASRSNKAAVGADKKAKKLSTEEKRLLKKEKKKSGKEAGVNGAVEVTGAVAQEHVSMVRTNGGMEQGKKERKRKVEEANGINGVNEQEAKKKRKKHRHENE